MAITDQKSGKTKTFTSKELSVVFQDFINESDGFEETFKIAKQNSQGRIWLIGGFVYRGITYKIYGGDKPAPDFDFIVERKNDEITVPEGWSAVNNKYGNFKFKSAKLSMDFVPLDSVLSIRMRKIAPTIENYLTGTPLTIQSIAYDCDKEQIIGEIGTKAISDKIVAINYLENARQAATLKGMDLNGLIKTKAQSLGFTPILLDKQ